jgi:hypothetical protein
MFAFAKHSHQDSAMPHLLSIETSKERQFVALTTALDQVLSRGCRNACVLTFLGLGQRAASPPWPVLTLTDLWNKKMKIRALSIRFAWTSSWFAIVSYTPKPMYPKFILIRSILLLPSRSTSGPFQEVSLTNFWCRPFHCSTCLAQCNLLGLNTLIQYYYYYYYLLTAIGLMPGGSVY